MNTESSAMAATEGGTQKPKRGWFRRNWFWSLPLALIVLGVGGFFGFLEIHAYQVRSSAAFQKAFAKVSQDAVVKEAAGGEMKLVKWRAPHYFNSSTEEQVNCELRGPKATVAMHVLLRKNSNYLELKVDLPDGTRKIFDMSDGTNDAPTYQAMKKNAGPVVEKGPGPEVDFNIPDGK
jgi:hypothetical protein